MTERVRYFRKFPLTDYKDNPAINIMRRAALNSNVKNFFSAFYPYSIPDGERMDSVAFNYYDDVDYDWLIYHANDIIDPYYQVPLDTTDFEEYIAKKYGSARIAKRTVAYYKTNYESDDRILSTSGYQALTGSAKKYWNPVYNAFGLIGYERAKEDIYVSTNFIASVDYASEGTDYEKGTIVYRADDTSSIATVQSSNTSHVILGDIRGDFSGNTNYTLTTDDNANATINATSYSVLNQTIAVEELTYFAPVFEYDREQEKNESRREIYLIDNRYTKTLNKQLTEVLS